MQTPSRTVPNSYFQWRLQWIFSEIFLQHCTPYIKNNTFIFIPASTDLRWCLLGSINSFLLSRSLSLNPEQNQFFLITIAILLCRMPSYDRTGYIPIDFIRYVLKLHSMYLLPSVCWLFLNDCCTIISFGNKYKNRPTHRLILESNELHWVTRGVYSHEPPASNRHLILLVYLSSPSL